MYLNVVIMQSIWTKIVLSKYKYWQRRNYGGAVEELEVTLKLLEVQAVLSFFFLFCIHSFARSFLCHPVSVVASHHNHVRMNLSRRLPRRERRLAMPRRTLRLIDSLLKFNFQHKCFFELWYRWCLSVLFKSGDLGDRCSPWRHRRGRRLLNLSFILFLLPCIKTPPAWLLPRSNKDQLQ